MDMSKEKILIWKEIKNAAPSILKANGNPVEILLWSQGRTLEEVRALLAQPKTFQVENQDSAGCKDEKTRN